jgi:prefoldin subunit 5
MTAEKPQSPSAEIANLERELRHFERQRSAIDHECERLQRAIAGLKANLGTGGESETMKAWRARCGYRVAPDGLLGKA